ncbi:MAG: NUDIX domain-containing protein [Phycisphaerales bacterium]
MLQQTQVARVVEAFGRFMERFPSPTALADAPEEQVLAAWQGLGYYRRARLLHAAARRIRDEHAGAVPADAATLRALPGVGRYTAGAIASIVHGAREPIVDGNVLRVLSRVAGARTQAGDPASEAWAWRQAQTLVEACTDPAATNEGLMELGATVCTPAQPRCDACPLAARCVARREGSAAQIPAPRRSAARQVLWWHAIVDCDARGLLLEQRPERGLWARMWQPPVVESERALEAQELAPRWGAPLRAVGAFRHVTSHREVEFRVFVPAGASGAAPARDDPAARASCIRVPLHSLTDYALSNAAWRVLETAGVPVTTPPSAAGNRRAPRATRSAATGS